MSKSRYFLFLPKQYQHYLKEPYTPWSEYQYFQVLDRETTVPDGQGYRKYHCVRINLHYLDAWKLVSELNKAGNTPTTINK